MYSHMYMYVCMFVCLHVCFMYLADTHHTSPFYLFHAANTLRSAWIAVNAWLAARSWGASTPMKMCIQAVLDGTGALRHMNKDNSERPVCTTHPLTPVSTSFLFVFDTEWVMST